MRRATLLALPALLLLGCGTAEDGSGAAAPSSSSTAAATTSIADQFEAEMVDRGLTPRLGPPEQLQIDGEELCDAYAAGSPLVKANDLVTAGFETPDLIEFAEAVTTVLCPEYAPA